MSKPSLSSNATPFRLFGWQRCPQLCHASSLHVLDSFYRPAQGATQKVHTTSASQRSRLCRCRQRFQFSTVKGVAHACRSNHNKHIAVTTRGGFERDVLLFLLCLVISFLQCHTTRVGERSTCARQWCHDQTNNCKT